MTEPEPGLGVGGGGQKLTVVLVLRAGCRVTTGTPNPRSRGVKTNDTTTSTVCCRAFAFVSSSRMGYDACKDNHEELAFTSKMVEDSLLTSSHCCVYLMPGKWTKWFASACLHPFTLCHQKKRKLIIIILPVHYRVEISYNRKGFFYPLKYHLVRALPSCLRDRTRVNVY